MKIVNLTNKKILLYHGNKVVVLPPSDMEAEVNNALSCVGIIKLGGSEIPMFTKATTPIICLPEPTKGTFYFVTEEVAEVAWLQGRADVVCGGDLLADGYCTLFGIPKT